MGSVTAGSSESGAWPDAAALTALRAWYEGMDSRAAVERFLGERAGVEYWREQRHSADGFDRTRWASFAELGWLGVCVGSGQGVAMVLENPRAA